MSKLLHQPSALHKGVGGQQEPNAGSAVPVPRRLLVWLTYGVAGTALFPVTYLIAGSMRPDYHALDQAISTLSLGPGGWLQRANFIMCEVFVIWIAYVFRLILRGGRCATWYPLVRAVEGLGLIVIGFFSTDPAPGYPPGAGATASAMTVQGAIHLAFTTVVESGEVSMVISDLNFERRAEDHLHLTVEVRRV